jgi:hypothetical protein
VLVMAKMEARNLPVLVLVHPFSLFGHLNVKIIFGSFYGLECSWSDVERVIKQRFITW